MLCPMCKKGSAEKFKPFCSSRCEMLDLGNWFSGTYSMKAEELDDISEEELQKLEEIIENQEDL